MNEEIKEILDNLKEDIDGKFEWEYIDGYYVEQIKPLLDYITNLEQVNKNQAKRNSRQKLANTKQQELILKLQQNNVTLKERVEYLERSNNRREDTILGLRQEIYEQEDYKSRCEKAIEYIKSIDEDILNSMFLDESYISNYGAIELLNILQNGSDTSVKN